MMIKRQPGRCIPEMFTWMPTLEQKKANQYKIMLDAKNMMTQKREEMMGRIIRVKAIKIMANLLDILFFKLSNHKRETIVLGCQEDYGARNLGAKSYGHYEGRR